MQSKLTIRDDSQSATNVAVSTLANIVRRGKGAAEKLLAVGALEIFLEIAGNAA